MKMKQITNAFGMNTGDFSKMLGVSRQALYMGRIGAKRMRTIVERLEALAEELHEADCAEAQRRLDARYKAIDVLERVMRGEMR